MTLTQSHRLMERKGLLVESFSFIQSFDEAFYEMQQTASDEDESSGELGEYEQDNP